MFAHQLDPGTPRANVVASGPFSAGNAVVENPTSKIIRLLLSLWREVLAGIIIVAGVGGVVATVWADPALARPRAVGLFPRLYRLLIGPGHRLWLIVPLVLLALGVVVGGHIYEPWLAGDDLAERDTTIQVLNSEGEKIERRYSERSAQLAALQAKLTNIEAELDAIMPSENTYYIKANQSLIVGDGRLTIGLIGPPTKQGITLNINGKQQSLGAGETLRIAPNSSTVCHVEVSSFDMFKAVIHAVCEIDAPR